MKKLVLFFTLILCMSYVNIINAAAVNNKTTALYFYSPTCSTCQKLSNFFEGIKDKHRNLIIKKYNITDLKNKSLLNKYSQVYKVSEDNEGIVPVVFIRNQYFTGEKAIKQNLESEISRVNGVDTVMVSISEGNQDIDIKNFLYFKALSVFAAGLINGINPCSMSMLLFFISLITLKRINVLKIGIVFSIGKFSMYLLLGTVFFKILALLNTGWIHIIIRVLMILIIIILIFLNIKDFFAAKNENYNKIKLQLPVALRKFNHSLMKRISGINDLKVIVLVSFALGIIVSLGEFLCTGQIYLTTIVTILQTNTSLSLQALFYLVIYDFALIIPLIILTYIICRGREVFEVSEIIRERLHLIKLINAALFLLFAVVVIAFF